MPDADKDDTIPLNTAEDLVAPRHTTLEPVATSTSAGPTVAPTSTTEEAPLQGPSGVIDPIPDTRDALNRTVKVSGSSEKPSHHQEQDEDDEQKAAVEVEAQEGDETMIDHGEEECSSSEDNEDEKGKRNGHMEQEEKAEHADEDAEEEADDDGEEDGNDDDDNDEGEDGEESSDYYDEEEPTLKYARLGGATTNILNKDSATALAVCAKYIAMGTGSGAICVLDHKGEMVKIFKPHTAMINDLSIDTTSEFVAAASMDGKVSVQSLLSTKESPAEAYSFDLRRPMRCVALEPNFGKRNTRQLVSGGMAGNLILHEKGWLGHKETTLYSGEGPIWAVEWRANFIAWASDAGVRIYDTNTSQRITYISRAADSPRADLFKCTLHWQDDRTLLIAWADFIKVAVVQTREGKRGQLGVGPASTEHFVEVKAIFQVDCMVSGIAPHGDSYLILAYLTEDTFGNEATENRDEQRRKAGSRPELRIISKDGEELSSDAISLRNYDRYQCRDYSLCPSPNDETVFVISPQDIVVARPRDEADHVSWLIEQRLYEQALHALEKMGAKDSIGNGFDVNEVGKKYLDFLIAEGHYPKAAEVSPKILGINAKLWEDYVFLFADRGDIKTIIPYVPTHDPQLSRLVYEMILAHYLRHDQEALLRTIKSWPADIYDTAAVILALKAQLDRTPSSPILMECLAELFILSRQPGKALPYFLKLRRPGVFSLIVEHNLFTDVQDQALQLIEFENELEAKKGGERESAEEKETLSRHGMAINLLVEHTHSIPIPRVVAQLQDHRQYLFMYLDALFEKDAHLAFDYSDLQVDLYAEYDANRLMDFLRASNYYSLERAYKICDTRDLVPEMVFLLGRMGNNKRALNLIIERLGDVQRAIEFAKEQNDHDLWEDLLKYSENKPRFIRGLLENVGPEIDPIRLIRRIKNGLGIPGLKPALIKILQDFNLQISLMEGCKTILYSDCRQLALSLHAGQTNGFLWTGDTPCQGTGDPVFPQLAGKPSPASIPFGIHFLSGETFSSTHAFPTLDLPRTLTERDAMIASMLLDDVNGSANSGQARAMSQKIRFLTDIKAQRARDGDRGPTGVSVRP